MFEDIDDILKGKLKKKPDGFKSKRPFKGPNEKEDDMVNEITKFIEGKFGGKATVASSSGKGFRFERVGTRSEQNDHDVIRRKLKGTMATMAYIAAQANIPKTCKDVAGNELAVGDTLKCPGDEVKTVLELGWRYCVLSSTGDQTESDGYWFQEEIESLNFIKKI